MFGCSSPAELAFADVLAVVTQPWALIDDSQSSSWAAVNDGQTGSWVPVDDSNVVDWADIPM